MASRLCILLMACLATGAHGQESFFIGAEINKTTITYNWAAVIASINDPSTFINVGAGTIVVDIDSLDFPVKVVYQTDNFLDEKLGGLFIIPSDSTMLRPDSLKVIRMFPKTRRGGNAKLDTLLYERRGASMRERRNGRLTGRIFVDPFEQLLPIGVEGHKHPTQAEMRERIRKPKRRGR